MGRNYEMISSLFINKSQFDRALRALQALNLKNNYRHMQGDYSKCSTFPEILNEMEFHTDTYSEGRGIHIVGYEGSTEAIDDVQPVIEAIVPFLDFGHRSRQSVDWNEERYSDEMSETDDSDFQD